MYHIISKENCKDCKYTIELLEEFNLQYNVRDKNEYTKKYIDELKFFHEIKKYPIIFKNDKFIGSYYELYKILYKL